VPQGRTLQDLVPRSDAWQWRVHHDPARDPRRILRGEGVAHHVADVVGDEVGGLDLEPVEHARDIVALRLLVVTAVGM
jgi:hypothetical protein